MAATLAELRERAYSRLEDNNVFWRDNEVVRAINDAIKVVSLFSGYPQQTTTHTNFTVANQHLYSVPSGYMFLMKVEFAGRTLDKCSVGSLCNSFPQWLNDTTATTGCPVARWAPIGLSKFVIHPADSVGGNTVKVTGVVDPTPLAAEADTTVIPDEFIEVVDDLTVQYLTMKEGGQPFAQTSTLYNKSIKKLEELKRFTLDKSPRYFVEIESPK